MGISAVGSDSKHPPPSRHAKTECFSSQADQGIVKMEKSLV